MFNQQLNLMVNALVNGEEDKAKEYLSVYFNSAAARLINDDQPLLPTTPEQ